MSCGRPSYARTVGVQLQQKEGTIDILKEWERDPPQTEMTTMTALWYDFKRRRRDPASPICRFRDDIPDACARDEDAYDALHRAVHSIRPNGKMHNHQSKVSKTLPLLYEKLEYSIKHLCEVESFGQLYYAIELRAPKGIGPMTVYDVAVRFGAFVGVKPEQIWLHAGTLGGLKALGFSFKRYYGKSFPMELLPAILRNKDPDEVEDFLCTYRLAFERIKK